MNKPSDLLFPLLHCATIILSVVVLACVQGCADTRGRDIYVNMGCPQCHGMQGEGLPLGPPLRHLSQYWEKKELVSYVQNPSGFIAGDPRLKDLSKRYVTTMPSFMIDEEGRRQLAEYLLSLH